MHRSEEPSPSARSMIRDHIFRVLAHHVQQARCGPIATDSLYLMAAEELERSGVFERPRGRQNYNFANYIGKPSQVFPDYDMPPSIAHLMRQTIWDLCVQGILTPAPKRNPVLDRNSPPKHRDSLLSLDFVTITPYGCKILADPQNRIQVHDPDGYLDNFWNANPPPDAEMMRYLSESIAVFESGHLLAAVVLLAIASERLVEVLAEALRDALGNPQGLQWFQKTYKRRDISARFKQLSGKLLSEYGEVLDHHKLKDGFQRVVTLAFEEIRLARNDISHLSDRQFTQNEVSGLLHHFVQYFGYVRRTVALLRSHV